MTEDALLKRFPFLTSKAKRVIMEDTLSEIDDGVFYPHSYQSIVREERRVGFAIRLARVSTFDNICKTGKELEHIYKEIIDRFGYVLLPMRVDLGVSASIATVVHIFTSDVGSGAREPYAGTSDFGVECCYSLSGGVLLSEEVKADAVNQFKTFGISISNNYSAYIKCTSYSEPKYKSLLGISTGQDVMTVGFKGSAPCILVL